MNGRRLWRCFFVMGTMTMVLAVPLNAQEYAETVTTQEQADNATTIETSIGIVAKNKKLVFPLLSTVTSHSKKGGGVLVAGGTNVTTTGHRAPAIGVHSGQINLAGPVDLRTGGAQSHGLLVDSLSRVTLRQGLEVHTQGRDAQAVHVKGGGILQVTGTVMARTGGYVSSAIKMEDDKSSMTVTGSLIARTTGSESPAIDVSGGALFEVQGTSNISTEGDQSAGVSLRDQGRVFFGQYMAGVAGGDGVREVRAENESVGTGSSLAVKTKGVGSAAFEAMGGTVVVKVPTSLVTEGQAAFGGWAIGGGHLEFDDDVTIVTEGEIGGGFVAMAGGSVHAARGLQIEALGESSRALHARQASIDVDGPTILKALAPGSHTIDAWGGRVVLRQAKLIEGDIKVNSILGKSDAGDVDVHLVSGGLLKGAAYKGDFLLDEDNDGMPSSEKDRFSRINIIMDKDSRWDVSDLQIWDYDHTAGQLVKIGAPHSSSISLLNMNGGLVNLGTHTLKVEHLQGRGEFQITGALDQGTGGRLSVLNSSQGSYRLDYIDHSASEPGRNFKPLLVVENGASEAKNYSAHFGLGHLELGEYLYTADLIQAQSGDWYIAPSVRDPLTTIPRLNSAAQAAFGTLRTPLILELFQTSMAQRMGELRANPSKAGDGWFRAFGGRYDLGDTVLDSGTALSGSLMTTKGIQIGYDWRRSTHDGQWFYGMALGIAQADNDWKSGGSGTTKSKGAEIYGTYMINGGAYLDFVAHRGWHKSDYRMSSDRADDLSTNSWGLSVEVGKKFPLPPAKNGSDWFVEPQAQLNWRRFDGLDYRTQRGLHVESAALTSLVSRLGVLVGYEGIRNGHSWNAYGKLAWSKEYKADLDFCFNDGPFRHTGNWADDWWEFGLGLRGQFSSGVDGWLEVQTTRGARFDQKWQVIAGVKLTF